jgi:hypothetical protein
MLNCAVPLPPVHSVVSQKQYICADLVVRQGLLASAQRLKKFVSIFVFTLSVNLSPSLSDASYFVDGVSNCLPAGKSPTLQNAPQLRSMFLFLFAAISDATTLTSPLCVSELRSSVPLPSFHTAALWTSHVSTSCSFYRLSRQCCSDHSNPQF